MSESGLVGQTVAAVRRQFEICDETAPASPNSPGRRPSGNTSSATSIFAGASLEQRPQHRRGISRTAATAVAVAISVATISSDLVFRAGDAKAEELASGGSLSFFADAQDVRILLDRLNADPEIAFIVPDGPRFPPPDQPMPALPPSGNRPRTTFVIAMLACGSDDYWQRWRAVRPVDRLDDGEHSLWHISAGPLVNSDGSLSGELRPIPDPWSGWSSQQPVCKPNLMPHATIRLNLQTRTAAYTPEERATLRSLNAYWLKGDLLVASDFQWSAASQQPGGSLKTARWVAGLEDWFSRNAVGLHGRGDTQVFWAFPSALRRLKSGMPYYSRYYELDEAIRDAR
ncbi:hypothetical protein [Bradyrhizobium sp.]|uniref:hypothetical protein n=1 Tax=Bradyrhizobium sp. TaxID=376 RepID=UPI002CF77EB1|nr:hypothetical protein [Bradyrhizobium sp.]HWX60068.1 hypothetical protein [Bradyrhizobium sp.]